MKLLEVEGGHVPQCPIAGDATADELHKTKLRRDLHVMTSY